MCSAGLNFYLSGILRRTKVQFFHLMKMEWKFEVCYVPLSVHQTWVSTTPIVFGSD